MSQTIFFSVSHNNTIFKKDLKSDKKFAILCSSLLILDHIGNAFFISQTDILIVRKIVTFFRYL